MNEKTTIQLQSCLDRLRAGDLQARNELLLAAQHRLLHLTRKMLHDVPRLRRWEETDDVFQSAVLRLWRSLEKVTPESLRHFFHLSAVQIRRTLIDLYRHYFGPQGPAAQQQSHPNDASPLKDAAAGSSVDPLRCVAWTEFHEQTGKLPDEEREVFDLLWYQGLTHESAAELLGISAKTVQRRFRNAKIALYETLGGSPPGL